MEEAEARSSVLTDRPGFHHRDGADRIRPGARKHSLSTWRSPWQQQRPLCLPRPTRSTCSSAPPASATTTSSTPWTTHPSRSVATLKEEGDKVQGIVVYIGEITNEYGTSKVLHLQDRDGTIRSVGMFGARLNNWFEKTQPEYGDAVRIVCKGMTKTKNGKNEFRDRIAYVAHGTVRAATS